MTGQSFRDEWHRLASVPTMAVVLARHMADLAPVASEEMPDWLQPLPLPAGWRLAQFDAGRKQPARMAVCGAHPDGGWDGCETVSAFRFTGNPKAGLVLYTSDLVLRDLNADTITTAPLNTPASSRVAAVRSSGYLSAAGQRIWLQHSTYLAGSESPGAGILIEHGIFAVLDRQTSLHNDIIDLSNAILKAFVSTFAVVSEQNSHGSASVGIGDFLPSKGTKVATFRLQPFEDNGTPAILVNSDRDGMRILQTAVRSAHKDGAAAFEIAAIKHYVIRQDGAADIDLRPQTVVWLFDDAKLVEMLNLIEPLVEIDKPAHNYLDDLNSPVETLVLSVDEYSGARFGDFPQLSPAPVPAESLKPTASGVEADRRQEAARAEPLPPRPVTGQADGEAP